MAEDMGNGKAPAVSILPAPGQDEAVPVSSEEIREVILQVRDSASSIWGKGIKSSMQGSKLSAWVALLLVWCCCRGGESRAAGFAAGAERVLLVCLG